MGWKFILRSEWLGWGQTGTLTLNASPLGKERRLPGGRDAGVMGGAVPAPSRVASTLQGPGSVSPERGFNCLNL